MKLTFTGKNEEWFPITLRYHPSNHRSGGAGGVLVALPGPARPRLALIGRTVAPPGLHWRPEARGSAGGRCAPRDPAPPAGSPEQGPGGQSSPGLRPRDVQRGQGRLTAGCRPR